MPLTYNQAGTTYDDARSNYGGDLTIAVVTFPTVPPTLESVLAGHHTPVSKIEWLAADLDTVIAEADGKLLGGGVTMERTRDTHRSADISGVNDDGRLAVVDNSSLVWPSRIVRVSRGAMVGSTAQYVALITGIIDGPSFADNEGGVSFKVVSRLYLAKRQFSTPMSFAVGVRVKDEFRALCEAGGLGTSDALYDLDDGGLTRAQPRTYDTNEEILGAALKMAGDAGCEAWDTGAGVIVLRPFVDPAMALPVWTFTPGASNLLISKKHNLGALPGLYNRAVVIGTAPDRYPIRAEWRVTNPLDPLYNPPDGSGPVGDRPQTYRSPGSSTQQMCNAVAERLGIDGALGETSTAATGLPIPLVMADGRPVVAYVDENHLLDKVTMPLGPGGPMSMDSRQIRSLTA